MPGHRVRERTTAAVLMLIAVAAAIVLLPGFVHSSAASGSRTASASDPLTAGAQAQLDQVFGAGHSRIVASATYTNASSSVSNTYSASGSAPLATSSVNAPGYSASVVQNGVGQTVTQKSNPGGAISRLSVAVVVDASAHPNLRVVRRTVSAAMGLNPARGDRLSVVSAPMAVPAAASPVAPSWVARVTPYVPSGTAVIVALACAVALLTSRRSRKRSPRPGSA